MAMLRVRGIGVAVQGEHVDLGAQRLQPLLVAHAEAVLLVDHHQTEILEAHRTVQQPLRRDHDVHRARGDAGDHALGLLVRSESGQALDAHRPVGEAIDEGGVVLLGEQRRRHEHRHLLAGLHRDERRAQRDLGFPKTHIAAYDPIHRLARFQIAEHLIDRRALIGGLLERKSGLEGAIFGFARPHLGTFTGGAARVQVEQLCGDVAHALRGLAPRLLPLIAAELVQRRGLRRRSV